jgi:hypothetical protein
MGRRLCVHGLRECSVCAYWRGLADAKAAVGRMRSGSTGIECLDVLAALEKASRPTPRRRPSKETDTP